MAGRERVLDNIKYYVMDENLRILSALWTLYYQFQDLVFEELQETLRRPQLGQQVWCGDNMRV